MLPEEVELARLEKERTALGERLAEAEELWETAKAEIELFPRRYYAAVGHLYAKLDDLEAKLAELRAGKQPADKELQAQARLARRHAEKSAEELTLVEADADVPLEIPPALKQTFRKAAKLMHPDHAVSDHERQRRTSLMAMVNVAYKNRDQAAIEKLIEEFGSDPEAIVGEDAGSQIVKAVRRIAQLKRRLDEVQREMEQLRSTDLFQLRAKIEAAGEDALERLAEHLGRQASERQAELDKMQSNQHVPS